MAIVNAVAARRNVPYGAQDSRGLRIAATANHAPLTTREATPPECQALLGIPLWETAKDTSASFANGALPIAGGSGGPTTTVLFTVRSAEKEALSVSDVNYTDDLASRCAQFDVVQTEGSNTMTSTVRLLPAPQVGERAFATLQASNPRAPQDLAGTNLRVLAGTISISLALSVASDADAQPALGSMAAIAQDLIDQASNHPPMVSPPPGNSRTPEQVAGLVQGLTGPGGSAPLVQAQLIRSSGGTPSTAPCIFDEASYFGALGGSSMAQVQFSGAAVKSFATLTVVSMADSVAQPYPFDVRAQALRDCPSITENALGGVQGRAWSSLRPLPAAPGGDAGYAVVYELSDGTGEKHVIVGARKGTLTVEANDTAHSDSEVQPSAEALTALINQVFAKAGL